MLMLSLKSSLYNLNGVRREWSPDRKIRKSLKDRRRRFRATDFLASPKIRKIEKDEGERSEAESAKYVRGSREKERREKRKEIDDIEEDAL